MNFGKLMELCGGLAWFDLQTLLVLSGEPRHNLRMQLSRWAAEGKLLLLRRGLYALADPYRRAALNPAHLANHLQHPSYLSLHWALSYYDLIPEKTALYTSVTTRAPCRFENPIGHFAYRHLKTNFFFGSVSVSLGPQPVAIALPEKALLDLWHLEKGKWTPDRMREMRFQNCERVDSDRLAAFAARFASPRLVRTVSVWRVYAAEESEGSVVL